MREVREEKITWFLCVIMMAIAIIQQSGDGLVQVDNNGSREK